MAKENLEGRSQFEKPTAQQRLTELTDIARARGFKLSVIFGDEVTKSIMTDPTPKFLGEPTIIHKGKKNGSGNP